MKKKFKNEGPTPLFPVSLDGGVLTEFFFFFTGFRRGAATAIECFLFYLFSIFLLNVYTF